MYDGADLQLGIYFLIFILYLYFKSGYLNIFAPLLIPLLIFLYANFRKICFMGNNGSHFLSYIAAVFVIKLYNKEVFNSVEEIIIIMLIPGCDLVRLFFSRILKKRKFFESDLNHIHHILGKNKSNYTTQIIIFVLTLSPVIISEVSNSYFFGIICGILIYIFIISRKFNYL